ncbi:ParB N-terminal domain-containing protein [Persicobacter psychrovividus]|uniref:ParB/Sulfiredoxin domain-containing protein n=1 Tax=Persicobacter psychrovividus TaxID=387638 RepID=A0ABM7VNC2_9BACT|nr:hypothetical protein PEPS_47920 [Persicobacter psychrovividus]
MDNRTIDFNGTSEEAKKRKQIARTLAGLDTNMTLDILPELDLLIPRPSQEEVELLEESILAEGLREPISIWKHNSKQIIVDGHNRYAILKRHNLPLEVNILHFQDIEEVKDWMINTQLGRRNLTDEKRAYLIGMKYEREKKQQGRKKKLDEEKRKDFPLLEGNTSNISAKTIANQVNQSDRTIRNYASFYRGVNLLSTEMQSDLLEGNIKISKGHLKKISQHAGQIKQPIQDLEELSKTVERFTLKSAPMPKPKASRALLEKDMIAKAEQVFAQSEHLTVEERAQLLDSLSQWAQSQKEQL